MYFNDHVIVGFLLYFELAVWGHVPFCVWQLALCLVLWRCSVNVYTIDLFSQLLKTIWEMEHPSPTRGVIPRRWLLRSTHCLCTYDRGKIPPVQAPGWLQLLPSADQTWCQREAGVLLMLCGSSSNHSNFLVLYLSANQWHGKIGQGRERALTFEWD